MSMLEYRKMTDPTRTTSLTWAGLVGSLLHTVPDNFRQHFGRIVQFFETMGKEVSDTAASFEGRVETPQQVHDFIQSYIRQFDHFEDMASLQNAHLMHDGANDPTVLNMSIYTLSGMREQLTEDIAVFDRLMESSAIAPPLAAKAAPPIPHPDHHNTLVIGVMPSSTSWKDKIRDWFSSNAQVNNARLVRELGEVYRKFRDRARDVQQMFRLAEPKNLTEMYTPMDAMRALRDFLAAEEGHFYTPKKPGGD